MKKLLFFISLFIGISLYSQEYGIVNFSADYMREEPSYTAELGNQSLMGTVVKILEQKGYWIKIESPEPYIGWVNELGITKTNDIQSYIKSPKYICIANYTHIYSQPNKNSDRLSDLVAGDLLRKIPESNKSINGFIQVMLPSGIKGYVHKTDIQDFKQWVNNSKPTIENIIKTARTMLGTPYLWGGTSTKGVDCSGLIRYAYFMNGLLVPRNATEQAKMGDNVDIGEIGQRTIKNLKRGDLLFFGNIENGKISHVGIYLGNNLFIHSSQVVRISHLIPTESDTYNGIAKLICARRIDGNINSDKGLCPIEKSENYF